tara:strand:- start:227 stop:433 length:207 start_codon:yes stop_codon:yes gene_type:complete
MINDIIVYEIRAIVQCPKTRWEITPSDNVWTKVGKDLFDIFDGEKKSYAKSLPNDINYNNPFKKYNNK